MIVTRICCRSAVDKVDSYLYANLHIGYDISDRLSLGLGVENLFDKDPPLMPHVYSNNTDTLHYDVFGRSYRLNLRANFGD